MSSGFKTSPTLTMELTATLPSFTLPSTAMCEWQSMIPGVTNIPEASITVAPAASFTFFPTSAILPSRIRIDPCSMVPFVTVRMVAFLITVTPDSCAAARDAPKVTARHDVRPKKRTVPSGFCLFMVVLLEPCGPAQARSRSRAGEIRGKIGTTDRPFQIAAFQRAGKREVLRAGSPVRGNGDGECVGAEVAGGDRGSAKGMGDRSGNFSAGRHDQFSGSLLRALLRGKRDGPLPAEVALGRLLGFLGLLDFKPPPIHE